MENQEPQNSVELTENQAYNLAYDLMINKRMTITGTRNKLKELGVDEKLASSLAYKIDGQITEAKKSAARKDILWGAVWCVGGLVLSIANIGYLFWGAILFGGIQLIRGLVNYNQA